MVWFSYLNWLDSQACEITPDLEVVTLPASNLQQRSGDKIWRTPEITADDSSAGFLADFGATREVQALAFIVPRINDPGSYDHTAMMVASDTVRHRLDLTTPGAGTLHDSTVISSGVLDGYGYHVYKLNTPVNARYWRCDLNVPSRAGEGFFDMSRAWAGPVVNITIGFNYGENHTWLSDSIVYRAARGIGDIVETVDSLQSWSLDFGAVTDAERAEFINFERRLTHAGQFLICRDDLPAGTRAMFARQETSSGITSVTYQRNRKLLKLVESI